jgi:hypothetical protein
MSALSYDYTSRVQGASDIYLAEVARAGESCPQQAACLTAKLNVRGLDYSDPLVRRSYTRNWLKSWAHRAADAVDTLRYWILQPGAAADQYSSGVSAAVMLHKCCLTGGRMAPHGLVFHACRLCLVVAESHLSLVHVAQPALLGSLPARVGQC